MYRADIRSVSNASTLCLGTFYGANSLSFLGALRWLYDSAFVSFSTDRYIRHFNETQEVRFHRAHGLENSIFRIIYSRVSS